MKRLIYGFCLLFSFMANAQATYKFEAAGSLNGGFIIPHSQDIENIADSNPFLFSAEISSLRNKASSRAYCSCEPRYGLSFYAIDFGNRSVLGNAYTLNFFTDPRFYISESFFFTLRPSIGLAYATNPYDIEDNPNNLFYSTDLSFLLSLSIKTHLLLNSNRSVFLSADYNHISNGGLKNPNKGINFPTIGLGYAYRWGETEPLTEEVLNITRRPDNFYALLEFIGSAQTQQRNDASGRYALLGLGAYGGYRVNNKSSFLGGLEYIYDDALAKEYKELYDVRKNPSRLAFMMGHHFHIGKVTFGQLMGIYLFSEIETRRPFYQRWTLTYQFTEKIYAGGGLKAHLQVADFLDFRIGYLLD